MALELNVNRKVKAEMQAINSIPVLDAMVTLNMQAAWLQARKERVLFLDELKDRGLTGKEYSDEVVAYDKKNMNPLW